MEGHDDQVRVLGRIENASTFNSGVRFGVATPGENGAPATLISEPISPELAARFCQIGYALLNGDADPDVLARIDAEIAATVDAEAEAQAGGATQRELTEHQTANLAMAEELRTTRAELEQLRQRGSPAALAASEQKLETAQLMIAAKNEELAELRRVNEQMATAPSVGVATATHDAVQAELVTAQAEATRLAGEVDRLGKENARLLKKGGKAETKDETTGGS